MSPLRPFCANKQRQKACVADTMGHECLRRRTYDEQRERTRRSLASLLMRRISRDRRRANLLIEE